MAPSKRKTSSASVSSTSSDPPMKPDPHPTRTSSRSSSSTATRKRGRSIDASAPSSSSTPSKSKATAAAKVKLEPPAKSTPAKKKKGGVKVKVKTITIKDEDSDEYSDCASSDDDSTSSSDSQEEEQPPPKSKKKKAGAESDNNASKNCGKPLASRSSTKSSTTTTTTQIKPASKKPSTSASASRSSSRASASNGPSSASNGKGSEQSLPTTTASPFPPPQGPLKIIPNTTLSASVILSTLQNMLWDNYHVNGPGVSQSDFNRVFSPDHINAVVAVINDNNAMTDLFQNNKGVLWKFKPSFVAINDDPRIKKPASGRGKKKRKSAEETTKTRKNVEASLSNEAQFVLQIIRGSGNNGIWTKYIGRDSGLTTNALSKIYKNLESLKLIKSVKGVKDKAKKKYLDYELTPSDEITGGPWFTDSEFDEEFVNELKNFIYRKLSGHPRGMTLRKLSEAIVKCKITKVDLTKKEVLMLLQRLIYECDVERCVRRVGEPGWEEEDKAELEGDGKYEDFTEYDTRVIHVDSDEEEDEEGVLYSSDDGDEEWTHAGEKKSRGDRGGGNYGSDSDNDEDDSESQSRAGEQNGAVESQPRILKKKIVYYCVRQLPPHPADNFFMWEVLHEDFSFRTMQIDDGMIIQPHEDHYQSAEKTT